MLKFRLYQNFQKNIPENTKKRFFYVDEINRNRWILKELKYTLIYEH